MNGQQLVDSFEFDKYAVFNEIVDSEPGLEPHFAIHDWKLQLVFELQPRDDSLGDVVDDHHAVFSSASSAVNPFAVQELSPV